jgi:hypothetical protein
MEGRSQAGQLQAVSAEREHQLDLLQLKTLADSGGGQLATLPLPMMLLF